MTITLPKPLRTYQYRPLTVFSLLDTEITLETTFNG